MRIPIDYTNKNQEELMELLFERDQHIRSQQAHIQSQAKQISILEEYILAHKHR